jgi:hypothetical protein
MGKDVTCDYLVQSLNASSSNIWQRTSFADSVKKIYEIAFGVDRDFIENWKRNSNPPDGMLKNVRQGLQFIGDGFRTIKSDIWINIALRDESKNICISDGRYINEAKAVKEKNGITILLYRPAFLNDDPNPSESQLRPLLDWASKNLQTGPIDISNAQQAEIPEGLQYFDYFLVNDGEIEDLHKKIDEFVIPYITRHYAS